MRGRKASPRSASGARKGIAGRSAEDAPASQLREDEVRQREGRIERDVGRPPLGGGLFEVGAPRRQTPLVGVESPEVGRDIEASGGLRVEETQLSGERRVDLVRRE